MVPTTTGVVVPIVGERETPGLMTNTMEQVSTPSRHVMEGKIPIASRNGEKISITSRDGEKTSIASRDGHESVLPPSRHVMEKKPITSRDGNESVLSPSRHVMEKKPIPSRDGDKSSHHVTEWKVVKYGRASPVSKKSFCGQDSKLAKNRGSLTDVVKSEKVAKATFSRK